MENQNNSASKLSKLCQKAELQSQPTVKNFPLSEADTQKLIHELEVHQIELEMQLGELTLAKKQLAESAAQKFEVLYDLAPSGYFTLTNEGEIIDANLTGSQMLGKERSRLIGGRFAFFVSNETKPKFNQFLERAFNTKVKTTCELTLLVNDNSPIHVLLHATATGDGKLCYVNTVDITDQKEAERIQKESLERLHIIAGQVPGLVYQFRLRPDGSFCFPYASEAIQKYYGVTPEEVRENGNSAFANVHPDDRAGMFASIHTSALKLEFWQHEFRVTLADGSVHTLLGSSRPQKEADGSVLWSGFISDITNQKRVEKELHHAHLRMKSIVDATQTGTWEWNIQTNEIVINDFWAQISGYTTDELTEMNTASFRSMVHPDDLKQADQLLARHFSGELPYFDFEYRLKHKDGHWIWIHDRGSVSSRTDDSKPLLMFGTHSDITERKTVEETLFESEKRFRMLFENSLTGIMVTHPDGAILAVNPEACRLFGRTEAEICNLGRIGVVDIENPNLSGALEKRRQTGHFHGELTYKRFDGSIFPVDIESGIFTDANGQDYAYNFFHDITERKQNEKTLQDSEEHLQLALTGAQMGMWYLNVKTMGGSIDSHAAQILGYQKDDIPGEKLAWDSLTHPDDVPEIEKVLINHLSGKTPYFESEHRMRHASGEYRWVSGRGKITKHDQDGSPLLISGTIMDITEQKQNENELKKSKALYSFLTENSTDAVALISAGDKVDYISPSFNRRLGYEENELKYLNFQDILQEVHPDERSQITAKIRHERELKLTNSIHEYRIKNKEGGYVWLEDVIHREFNEHGNFLRTIINSRIITDRKLAENTLTKQQELLSKLTKFSIDLSMLPSNDNLEEFICKQIKQFTGAIGVLFSEYDEESGLLSPKHIELEAKILGKVVSRLDNKIQDMHSFVDDETYQRITQHIVERYDSLSAATFGTISRPVGAILSTLLKAGSYIGLSFMVDGKLYGSSLLVLDKQQPELPLEFIENIASMVGMSLRRKRAEVALKDSEYKYKLLTQSNSDVVFIIDKLGRLLFANESVKQVLGYDPEEVIGKSMTTFVSEKQIPEALLQLGSAFIHKEVNGFFTQIYHKDKHLVDVEINGKIVGYNGQMVGQGTIRNITEKKQIEARLKFSLDRNKALLKANPDLMFVFDSSCRIIDFHAETTDELYVKPELFLNKTIDEVFPHEISQMTHRCVNAVLSTGKSNFSTYELPMGNTLRSYESRYVLNGKNEVLSIVRDITDRKLAEAALLKRKHLYDNLVSKIPVGVYILRSKPDGAFALDYASPRMAEMLHLSVESLLTDNQTIFKAIHPDDLDGFRTLSQDGIYQHRPFNWKGRIVADENIKWMHFMSTPEMLKDGDILWHGLIVDITERKLAEQEISRKNEELSNLIAEKDKFFSIIAHDLRSPFNVLLGLTQLLDEDLPTMQLDESQKMVSILRGSALSAYDLLENLLEWSRIKRGITNFDPESFMLLFKLDETLKPVLELAHKKLIEFSYSVPDNLVVFADQNMMSSIIRNLISNAIKFTPKNGKIFLFAQITADQNIEISVKDSGIGMNKNILDKLFNIDNSSSRKGTDGESSSGLGLNICKEFVEKHGGRIWAESQEGKGSTFYLTLPNSKKVNE